MTRFKIGALTVALALLGGGPFAFVANAAGLVDRVRLGRNSDAGEVVEMTRLEVTIDKGSSGTRKYAVNEIRSLLFDNEPMQLTQARLNVRNGGYATALERLNAIDLSDVERDLVQQDIEFYTAFCAAKLALGGDGEITNAGRQLNTFVRGHPQSFHYFEAVELMGDLLVASDRKDKYEGARRQYEALAEAPWPDYQMRAAVLVGRTLQSQEKHEDAIQKFDSVLAMAGDSEPAQSQKLAATLGKAASLAGTDRLEGAVRMIEGVIQNADPEQKELQSRAYNQLGLCYERAGQTKDALLAFLHVDVLYSTVPEAHAEALAHLIPLWRSIGQESRARQAQQTYDDRYAGGR